LVLPDWEHGVYKHDFPSQKTFSANLSAKRATADKEQLEHGVYGKTPVSVTKSFNMFFTGELQLP
jgi:hypothetical protein